MTELTDGESALTGAASLEERVAALETISVPRHDLDCLLAVATLYLRSFRPDEMVTLPEKFAWQDVEEVVKRHGRRH